MDVNNVVMTTNGIFGFLGLLGGYLVIYSSISGWILIGTKRFDTIYLKMKGRDISWADFGFKLWELWGIANDAFWKYKTMMNDKNSKIHLLTTKERKAIRRNGWCTWVGGFIVALTIAFNSLALHIIHWTLGG